MNTVDIAVNYTAPPALRIPQSTADTLDRLEKSIVCFTASGTRYVIISAERYDTLLQRDREYENSRQTGMTRLARPISAGIATAVPMEKIEALYIIRDREEVEQFIGSHLEITGLLLEAPVHVMQHFGDSSLGLRMGYDRDCLSLFICIQTDKPAREAVDALDALDYGWWLDASDPVHELLEITLERRRVV